MTDPLAPRPMNNDQIKDLVRRVKNNMKLAEELAYKRASNMWKLRKQTPKYNFRNALLETAKLYDS